MTFIIRNVVLALSVVSLLLCTSIESYGQGQYITTPCFGCSGTGKGRCTVCAGTGKFYLGLGYNRTPMWGICNGCGGSGRIPICLSCGGRGKIVTYVDPNASNNSKLSSNNSSDRNSGNGKTKSQSSCFLCNGTGQTWGGSAPDYTGKSVQSYCSICGTDKYPHYHKKCTSCGGTGTK